MKQDPDDKCSAICCVCEVKMKNCNKSALLKHKSSSRHNKILESKKKTLNIQQFFKQQHKQDIHDKVARVELLLSGYVAEHRIPFAQCDHLVDVIKRMFPDNEIARSIKMRKTTRWYRTGRKRAGCRHLQGKQVLYHY